MKPKKAILPDGSELSLNTNDVFEGAENISLNTTNTALQNERKIKTFLAQVKEAQLEYFRSRKEQKLASEEVVEENFITELNSVNIDEEPEVTPINLDKVESIVMPIEETKDPQFIPDFVSAVDAPIEKTEEDTIVISEPIIKEEVDIPTPTIEQIIKPTSNEVYRENKLTAAKANFDYNSFSLQNANPLEKYERLYEKTEHDSYVGKVLFTGINTLKSINEEIDVVKSKIAEIGDEIEDATETKLLAQEDKNDAEREYNKYKNLDFDISDNLKASYTNEKIKNILQIMANAKNDLKGIVDEAGVVVNEANGKLDELKNAQLSNARDELKALEKKLLDTAQEINNQKLVAENLMKLEAEAKAKEEAAKQAALQVADEIAKQKASLSFLKEEEPKEVEKIAVTDEKPNLEESTDVIERARDILKNLDPELIKFSDDSRKK